MADAAPPPFVTFLFTDIEGSVRLMEQWPERMPQALARHDEIARRCVSGHGGRIIKTTGDGVHAVFERPLDAVQAALALQLALADPAATQGLTLRVRCGLHGGHDEARDGDFFGPAVNRAARIMGIAHGGQTLLSQAVAERVVGALPPGLSLNDLGRVRLRDLGRPERVHQLQHAALRAQFPPLRSLEATPNNLAQQLDSFVGRERELAEVRERLQGCRLLTLLGMGGLGKSRLSVQLGAEVLDEYPDGVWLIEFAPLTDPRLVPQAVASVLGVKEEAGLGLTESLLQHVRDRQLLLILDNCEHLVHACADIAKQLLQAGPGVRLLASSRTVLQVAGEATYPVPTLGVPGPGSTLDPETLTRHEAVRLFMDRAAAARAGFRLTAANAAAVADICHRLDGIPLAIELAAARTRALSAEAIAARLGDRFKLLVTGDQTVLPRQRTLRALIDWSHDLLSDAERLLFRRLAVFAGGWTLEAAEAVCSSEGLDAADVLDLQTSLVEKSLVVMEAGGGRYRMLDTVRHYAMEQLAAAADGGSARERHLTHYLALAEEARTGLQSPQQADWLTRLDDERENLLAAHAQCDGAHPDAGQRGLRLVYALRPYWLNRGLLGLGLGATVDALARPGAQTRDLARFRGLLGAGWLAYFMGRYPPARHHLEEGLAIAREAGNTEWAARVLQPLGMACLGAGDVAAAQAHLEEAVTLARGLGNERELVAAVNSLAQFHRLQGRPEVALPLYEQALPVARRIGDLESVAILLLNLAMVTLRPDSAAQTAALLIEALQLARQVGSKPGLQSLLEVSAGLACTLEDWPMAATLFGAAASQAQATGLQRDPADEAFVRPLYQRAEAAAGAAAFATWQAQGAAAALEATLGTAADWLAVRAALSRS